MSPETFLTNMDVEISEGARGSTDLVPGPPVMFGQDLVQVPNEITADTPEKSRLRKQVSDLVDALQYEENKVHQEIHEVKVDAGEKVKAFLKGIAGKLQTSSYRIRATCPRHM